MADQQRVVAVAGQVPREQLAPRQTVETAGMVVRGTSTTRHMVVVAEAVERPRLERVDRVAVAQGQLALAELPEPQI